MSEMDELLALQDAMFKIFDEELVREIAEREEFSVDVVPDMLDDESVTEQFAEMVNFVVQELSDISETKVKSVLLSAGIEEDVIDGLLLNEV